MSIIKIEGVFVSFKENSGEVIAINPKIKEKLIITNKTAHLLESLDLQGYIVNLK